MSHSNNDHIERALRSAEARQMFFHASDQATRHQLDRRLVQPASEKHLTKPAGPIVVKIRRGLYVRAVYWDTLTKTQRYIHLLRSLQNQHPEWVFCMQSAAAAHGLPVPHAYMNRVHLATNRGAHGARGDVVRHRIVTHEITIASNVRVTSLLRTGFDCTRVFDFGHGLAVCDALLRRLGWSSEQLVSAFQDIPGRHKQRRQALRVASHANALSESAGESMARGYDRARFCGSRATGRSRAAARAQPNLPHRLLLDAARWEPRVWRVRRQCKVRRPTPAQREKRGARTRRRTASRIAAHVARYADVAPLLSRHH